jgi:hypothetical protein
MPANPARATAIRRPSVAAPVLPEAEVGALAAAPAARLVPDKPVEVPAAEGAVLTPLLTAAVESEAAVVVEFSAALVDCGNIENKESARDARNVKTKQIGRTHSLVGNQVRPQASTGVSSAL